MIDSSELAGHTVQLGGHRHTARLLNSSVDGGRADLTMKLKWELRYLKVQQFNEETRAHLVDKNVFITSQLENVATHFLS
jgi:hypothetical protein